MRTKTLLLSAALGALSSASLMAQVYSLNAVGYINVTIQPGLNQVADQLYSTNGLPNYISPTLDSQLGNSASFVNARIYKFNPTTEQYLGWQITSISQGNYTSGNATEPYKALTGVDAATVTLNPGEAVWFYSAQTTNVTLTFVGTVPSTNSTLAGLTNSLVNNGTGGLQMVSSIVPIAGQLDTVLGIQPTAKDSVYIYVPSTQSYQGFKWSIAGSWTLISGAASAPVVTVGQGFWYNVFTPSTTNNWVQVFGVSQ